MTEYLLENGHNVVAAVRKPESLQAHVDKYGASRLLPVKVNVQQLSDVQDAFSKAKAQFGRVDVVYNNAGYSCVGEVEATPIEDGRGMFEVRARPIIIIQLFAV